MTSDWRDHAACIDMPADLFFPGSGEDPRPAQAVCATCPVTAQCLAYALASGEHHGVWGGVTEKQRKRMRTGNPRPAILNICSVCNRRFEARIRGARYCSPTCRNRASRARLGKVAS